MESINILDINKLYIIFTNNQQELPIKIIINNWIYIQKQYSRYPKINSLYRISIIKYCSKFIKFDNKIK